jgi:hypothetical protein
VEQDIDNWVTALRSGNYKQTCGTLKNRNGMCCCLGVKLISEGVSVPPLTSEQHESYAKTGLSSTERTFFIRLNDGDYRLTFEEIALVIEHLPRSEWMW